MHFPLPSLVTGQLPFIFKIIKIVFRAAALASAGARPTVFLYSELCFFLYVMIKRGMWVGYQFCVCPISEFPSPKKPTKEQEQEQEQERNSATHTDGIPTVWQVMHSPEIE